MFVFIHINNSSARRTSENTHSTTQKSTVEYWVAGFREIIFTGVLIAAIAFVKWQINFQLAFKTFGSKLFIQGVDICTAILRL